MTEEETLRSYENDANAQKTIRDSITQAYQDLRPELELVHGYETAALPTFYESYNTGYGMSNDPYAIDPTTRMQLASRNAAIKTAGGRVARDILDTRRAGMEDLIGDTYDQWNQGYGMAQNKYNRWYQQQKDAEDKRRWEAEMELQKQALARSGGGGGGNYYNFGTPEDTTPTPTQQGNPNLQKFADLMNNARNNRGNKYQSVDINTTFNQLKKLAAQWNIPITSEQLWYGLGNSPSSKLTQDQISGVINLTRL